MHIAHYRAIPDLAQKKYLDLFSKLVSLVKTSTALTKQGCLVVVLFLYQMAQPVPPVLYSCFPSSITLEHAGSKNQKWRGGSKHTAWKEINTSPVKSIFINSQKGAYKNFLTMLQTWTICSSKSAAILRRLASNL